MKRITVLAVLGVFAIATLPAQANPPHITLVVAPATAHVSDHLFFSGCGYGQNKELSVWAEAPGSTTPVFEIGLRADSEGCFDTALIDLVYMYDGYQTTVAGTHEFYVFYKHGSGVSDYGNGQPVSEVYYEVLP